MKQFVDFASIRELCRQRFAYVVPRSPRSINLLADNTEQQLVEALADRFSEDDVRAWFASWTARPDYQRALKAGGQLFDCDGHAGWLAPER
jgi:hypothetical protein